MGSSWSRRLLMLVLIMCLLQPLLPVSRGCFPEEREALMEIHASLIRANSSRPLPSWGKRLSGHDDCCSWELVRCSNTTRRVNYIELGYVYDAPDSRAWSLDTSIFAAFPDLQYLSLSSNSLTQLSFDGFKNLSNLRELNLGNNSISGNIPSFLFSLPHIEVLLLALNMFEGPIPISSSSNLSSSLKTLWLCHNNLSGEFSLFWLKNLNNLVDLRLSMNYNLRVNVNNSGWVPQFQLRYLDLSGCDLDKSILATPKFLGTQHYLESLELSNNNLSMGIPKWLFTTNIVYLILRNNSLTGSLDPIRYPQTSLEHIDVSINNIEGQLPTNFSSMFPNLSYIDVSDNNFSGEIPTSLCHIKNISTLDLSNNKFSGDMPICMFTDLQSLFIFRVTNNHLGGPILGGMKNLSKEINELSLGGNKFEGELPRNLSGRNVMLMDLHDNKLSGELDTSFWNLPFLELLDVSSNNMTGEINPHICALPRIEYLDISNNQFIGSITGCISNSMVSLNVSMNSLSGYVSWEHLNTPKLINLDIRHNKLTGNLSWVHPFQKIRTIFLGHNEFHGQIPPSLCDLKYLSIIDISHNKLSGPVLPCIGAIPFQANQDTLLLSDHDPIFFYINDWGAMGRFSFDTKGMQLTYGTNVGLMYGINLSKNKLSGEIPQELGDLSHVKSLNLSHNTLVGPIPASLSSMSEVESLDLSHNELTGAIPPELARLQSLEVFSVAYNHLSGCMPSSGQFSTFNESSYEGNNLEMECPSSPTGLDSVPISPQDEMVIDAGTYMVSAASFVLAFWATVAFSFCHSSGRRLILKL